MRRTRTRITLATAALGMAALTACGGSPGGTIESVSTGTAGPSATSVAATDAAATSAAATSAGKPASAQADPAQGQGGRGVSAGPGCPANDAKIPAGASKIKTSVDVDDDGLVDTLWLSDSSKGIRTASGATFSQTISNAGGPQVSIRAIAIDGIPVVMENGRQAYVSAVVGCALTKTLNKQGQQYAFDLGFTDPGTNYGCATIKGERQLVGLAVPTSGMSSRKWLVEQTVVNLTGEGTSANNGATKVVNSYRYADKPAALARVNALASTHTCGTSESLTRG